MSANAQDRFTVDDIDGIAAEVRALHDRAVAAESEGDEMLADDYRREAEDLAEMAADDIAGE